MLAKNACQYERFAIALKVEDGFVKELSGDDKVVKLGYIIEKWRTSQSSSVTWANIIKVVESDILGNNKELANEIRNWLEKDENFSYYAEQQN